MTCHRIGVNLWVSGYRHQGAGDFKESNQVIKLLKKVRDDIDCEFAYFGIFDDGIDEAKAPASVPSVSASSTFCRDNLLNEIIKYDGFWTDNDNQVLGSIKKGFLDTQRSMSIGLDSSRQSERGPSTASIKATITIIKQGKLYSGHVGNSALVVGGKKSCDGGNLVHAFCIAEENKPDDSGEQFCKEDAGRKVIVDDGTQVSSSNLMTETDLLSSCMDVAVLKLDPNKHHCLILASDSLWSMLTPEESVNMVMDLESQFEENIGNDGLPSDAVNVWNNSAEHLVSRALEKCQLKVSRVDHTACVVAVIDNTLQPSKRTLLKKEQRELSQEDKLSKMQHFPENENNCSLCDSHLWVKDDDSLTRPTKIFKCRTCGAKIETVKVSDSKNDDHFLQNVPPQPGVHLQNASTDSQSCDVLSEELLIKQLSASGDDKDACKDGDNTIILDCEGTV